MKKYLILFVTALAGLTVLSCNKEEKIKDNAPEAPAIHFTVVADGTHSKTVVDASENWVNWSATDELLIFETLSYTQSGTPGSVSNEGTAVVATLTESDKKASFNATVGGSDFPDGASDKSASYTAVYPISSVSEGGSGSFKRMMMPATQHPGDATFDPAADLLLSAPVNRTERANGQEIAFRFHRLGTAVKMTLVGLPAGEILKKVELTAPVNIAGYIKPDLSTGDYKQGEEIPYSNGSKTVTLLINDITIDSSVNGGNVDIWFRVLPGTWDGKLEVVATTDHANYYRNEDHSTAIDLSSPNAMVFADGGRTSFSVNMGSAVSGPLTDLQEGHYVVLAKDGENYYAMKAEKESGKERLLSVSYTESLTSYNGSTEIVWNITKSGESYIFENSSKYLGYKGSSNESYWLEAGTEWTTDNYLLDVTPQSTAGLYHVTLNSNSSRYLSKNSSSNFFAFYGNTGQKADIVFVPATVDTRTAVTLSFNNATVNFTDSDYNTFQGQEVTADPNVADITGHISWSYEDNEGIINAFDNGVLSLNGNFGTATVTASFAGDANYQPAEASYSINVSSASGPQYELVSAVADVTAGDYIITWDNTYYLPSGATSGANPAVGDGISVANNKITNTVTTDMVWTFTGNNTDGFTISDGTNILHSTNAAQGISIITSSTRKWTVSLDDTYGMLLRGDDGGTRNLAVYNSASWRYYSTGNSYSGTLRLYKLGDARPEAPISWSADSGTAAFSSGGVTYNLPTLNNTESLTVSYASANEAVATVDASGVVTAIGEGTSVISATYDGSDPASTYKSTTVSYTLTVSDNRTPCAAPVFNPGAGEVTAGSTVAITSSTAGATIYYTTGSSDFSAGDWTAYTAPVAVTTACTIKAIATAANYKNSEVSSAHYTIQADASTVAQVLAGGAATDLKMNNLLVYAVNGKNAIIGDATGKMFLFMTNDLSVGDNISIASATTTVYNGILELTDGNITKNSSGNAIDHGTPVNMNDATAAASTHATFSASGYHSAAFVSMTGAQSGRYIQGSQENAKLYMNVENTTYDGKTVSVTGYIYSWSSSFSNYNFQVVTIAEDTTTPTISVSPTALNWAADATDGKSVTVTLNGSAAADDYTYSVTSGTAGDWNISDNGAGTITVSPKAANTSTTDAKTIVITVSHKDDTAVSAQVTCTQAKASSGGATPTLQYTLDGSITATGNAYATATNLTQGSIGWAVVGNTEMNPWRIGGKGLTNVDRALYSKTAISANISQINVTSGATASSLSVNSLTISVHNSAEDAASGANAIATKSVTTGIASSTVTFDKEDDTSWAGKYYRIVYNVTRTSTSGNGYITFVSATFYGVE